MGDAHSELRLIVSSKTLTALISTRLLAVGELWNDTPASLPSERGVRGGELREPILKRQDS